MSTTRNIPQSQVGFDLSTGEYVVYALFSGTTKYWTGTTWTTTFASAQLPTFGTGTVAGASTWTWAIASTVDPSVTDDGRIYMLGWESGVTPTITDPPTNAVEDFWSSGSGGITNLSASVVTATASSDNEPATVDLECCSGEAHPFTINLYSADGTANASLSGHTAKAVVSNWAGTFLFEETVSVGGSGGNVLTFTVSSSHATANAGEIWQLAVWDTTANYRAVTGTLTIDNAAVPV